MERLVSAVFGHPQAQSKNLFVQKLHMKVKNEDLHFDNVRCYIFVVLYNMKYDRYKIKICNT
jgi:hypothetical protein